MAHAKVIKETPSIKYIEPFVDHKTGFKKLKTNTIISIGNNQNVLVGDIFSNAIQYNENPLEAYNNAIAFGHDIYWLSSLGSALTSYDKEQEHRFQYEVNDKVILLDKAFKIISKPNNNFALEEI